MLLVLILSLLKPNNERVLVVPDIHAPYSHPDIVAFLAAMKCQFRPTRVVLLGDEIDGHAWSFHDHDPDLMSPGFELATAIKKLTPIYKLFPDADVLESNHGSLIYRRAKAHGLPARAIRTYREVISAPNGWRWSEELVMRLPNGQDVCFHHGRVKNSVQWSKSIAMNTVNGHFHEQFNIQYWRSPRGLFWSMVSGCLIDIDSMAFAYGRLNIHRPLLGASMIIDGLPLLVPMLLRNNNRWIGRLV